MFATDGTTPGDNLGKEFVQCGFAAALRAGLGEVHHDIGVDIAVAGMTETGDRQSVFLPQLRREFEKLFKFSAWHDDVLVEFCKAGVAERGGKFAADLPDFFALDVAPSVFDESRFMPANHAFDGGQFAAHGIFLAVKFNNQMRAANSKAIVFCVFGGGSERKFVGQFERAGQKSSGQNSLKRAHCIFHRMETDGKHRAKWRQRNQFQCGFGDNAEQTFRADKQPVQLKTGFVFVRATAEPDDGPVGERDFEAENVITRNAVFQTTGTAGVGGDVAADEVIRATGGVGRIKQSAPFNGFLERLRVDARLDDGNEIGGVDFLDAVHAFQRKHDAPAHGHAATNVAMARAARCHRNTVAIGKTEQGRDGLGGAGEGDGVRLMRSEPLVTGVFFKRLRIEDDFAGWQNLF